MNQAIELHDSELSAVVVHEDSVEVLLQSAYIRRSAGDPGKDADTGWLQSATLTFSGASQLEIPTRLPYAIWNGSLKIDCNLYQNVIPSVGEFSGDIQFAIELNNGEWTKVHGNHLRIELNGEVSFVEDVPAF